MPPPTLRPRLHRPVTPGRALPFHRLVHGRRRPKPAEPAELAELAASTAAASSGERPAPSTEVHNYRVTLRDSVAMGAVTAATTFLPVFIARLGGSAVEVGAITAIPAVAAVLLAIPIGQFLQARTGIVRWYSRARLLAYSAYGAIAVAIALVPPRAAIPAALAIWALAAVPATIGLVAFPVVMDGAAGPRGRYELMSRRWAVIGLTTAITVAVVGQLLERIEFPLNYQLVLALFSLAGVASFHYARQFRVADQPPPRERELPILYRIRAMARVVSGERSFLTYSVRQLVYLTGLRLALPLIPLWYVRTVGASDAWIGIIATTQSLALLVGYRFWRGRSRARGGRFVLLLALPVAALNPAVLSLVDQLPAVAALAAVNAVFSAGMDLALFDELMRRVPPAYGVTFTSIDTTLGNVASIAGPLLGAAIADRFGLATALQVGSLVSLTGFLLFAAHAIHRDREAKRRTDAVAALSQAEPEAVSQAEPEAVGQAEPGASRQWEPGASSQAEAVAATCAAGGEASHRAQGEAADRTAEGEPSDRLGPEASRA